jgi:hypothetical protein
LGKYLQPRILNKEITYFKHNQSIILSIIDELYKF